MKRLLLLGLLFPVTTFSQVSYSVTVKRLKALADDCDGGIITLCGNAPQDPIYNIWTNDAEANENTYCWIFDDDTEAEYNLWKDIQNLEIANVTNVMTSYISFDMSGYESDNLDPGCNPSSLGGDDAVIDREFVQQVELSTLTEGGTPNTMVINLQGVYFAEIDIVWYDLTASITSIKDAQVRVAPNPSNGNFKIQTIGISGEKIIEVRDMSGRTVHTLTTTSEETPLQLEGIASGPYVVSVRSNEGEVIERIHIH